jgi:hypothetical protein
VDEHGDLLGDPGHLAAVRDPEPVDTELLGTDRRSDGAVESRAVGFVFLSGARRPVPAPTRFRGSRRAREGNDGP